MVNGTFNDDFLNELDKAVQAQLNNNKKTLNSTQKKKVDSEIKKFTEGLNKQFQVLFSKFQKQFNSAKKSIDASGKVNEIGGYVSSFIPEGYDYETALKSELFINMRKAFHDCYNNFIDGVQKAFGEVNLDFLKVDISIEDGFNLFKSKVSDGFLEAVDSVLESISIKVNAAAKRMSEVKFVKEIKELISYVVDYLSERKDYLVNAVKDYIGNCKDHADKNYDPEVAKNLTGATSEAVVDKELMRAQACEQLINSITSRGKDLGHSR